jgi:hypothetical protein
MNNASVAESVGVERKASYTIQAFCADHGAISRSFFHKLVNDGRGPRLMKVGRRTLISAEAAAEWRAKMEAATNQTSLEV